MFVLICFWHMHLILCNYGVGGSLLKQGDYSHYNKSWVTDWPLCHYHPQQWSILLYLGYKPLSANFQIYDSLSFQVNKNLSDRNVPMLRRMCLVCGIINWSRFDLPISVVQNWWWQVNCTIVHTPAPSIFDGELKFDLKVVPEFEVLTQFTI